MLPPGTKRPPPRALHYAHVQTALALADAPTDDVLLSLNEKVRERGGIILANRQILTRHLEREWVLDRFFTDDMTSTWRHPRRRWSRTQSEYFGGLLGVPNPFQFGEDKVSYGRYCIGLAVPGGYLAPGERILGLVDAGRDDSNYYCPCHHAEVVYTTAHRLVCMACGQMHCALAVPLPGRFLDSWSEEEWELAFDANGVLLDHEVLVPFVEYQDVFAARKVWITDAWAEASSDIEFFARGDPEEIARWRAGAPTVEDLLEAGWSEVPQPPTPARQMEEQGFGVDIEENAALAINAAAADYEQSQTQPALLRSAILNAFHAIELLLKMRLSEVRPNFGAQRLTNPRVVAALIEAGVPLSANDQAAIRELRDLRNKLQHSGARYGFRDTRALLERAFVFLDIFTTTQLGRWLGGVVEQPAWDALLRLSAIQSNATAWADRMVAEWANQDGLNSIETCPHCSRVTVLRERSRAGLCVYCRRIPMAGTRTSA